VEQAATRQRTELTGLGRALFEGAPDPLLLVDPDTDRILEANPRAARLLGRDSDSLTELRFAELIASGRDSSESQTTAASLAEACSATRTASPSTAASQPKKRPPTWPTVELCLNDGSSAAVELLISRNEGVEGDAFLIVLRDVTESRRGSEIERLFHDSPVSLWEFDWSRLRQKLDEWSRSGTIDLRSWLEENPERVAELARETRIVSVNNGTLRMFGARDLADFRDNLASVFRQDSLGHFRQHLQARLDGQNRVEVENVAYTLQGERRHIQVIATAAKGCEETWERIYISVLDITDRKRAEMQQETQRQVLEQLVSSVDPSAALKTLVEQVKRQKPGLNLAIFRLLSDQQKFDLAEQGTVPDKFIGLLNGRHWQELAPLIEEWQVTDAPKSSPTTEIASDHPDTALRMSSLLGRLGTAVLAEGFRDCCLETIRNAEGTPLGLILVLRSGDGPFQPYEKVVIASARQLAAITFDHERDQQQAQLRTRELQSVFRAYPDVLLRFDSDGTIVEKHGADIAGLLNVSRDRLLGTRIWNALPDSVVAWLKEAVEKLHSGSHQETFGFHHQADDEERSLEIRVVPLADSGDVLAILRDVTVLQQTEQALEYASERFRHLFESSPDAIFVESIDGEILDANPAACTLHGMNREELVGQHVADLVPESLRDRVRETAREIQAQGDVSFDSYSLRRDGKEIPVDIRASSVSFDGQPALLFHVRDATRRVEEEQQRREHERQMAHFSRLSLMGQFVAGIAHEIRQPLWSISTFAEVTAETLERPDAGTRLDRIRDMSKKISGEVRRVNDITSRMFSFAKKSLPKRETATLQDVIETAASLCRPTLADRNIKLHVDTPDKPVSTICDRVLIEQTLVNLLTNASRAIENGPHDSGNIAVKLSSDAKTAQISVVDDGCGLPDDVTPEQLFEGFFTTDHVGLGIGLALSRSFVEEHGGRIWAEANTDAGMSFHFTLSIGNWAEDA
jgi:PAS domain S-box-containing protein